MNKFFEVKMKDDGSKCWVNIAHVTTIIDRGEYCDIYFTAGEDDCIEVNETYNDLTARLVGLEG